MYNLKDYDAYSTSIQHLYKQKSISAIFAIGPLETHTPKLFTFQQWAGQTVQISKANNSKIFICCLKF